MPSGLKVAQQSRPGFTPVSPAPPSAPLSVPGKLYAVGGYDGASRQCLSTVEQYNAATNEWTYVADMSTRRSGAGTGGSLRVQALSDLLTGGSGDQQLNVLPFHPLFFPFSMHSPICALWLDPSSWKLTFPWGSLC